MIQIDIHTRTLLARQRQAELTGTVAFRRQLGTDRMAPSAPAQVATATTAPTMDAWLAAMAGRRLSEAG